jgi:hypothetical protein
MTFQAGYYNILKFISDHSPVSKQTILDAFPEEKFNTSYRLKILLKREVSNWYQPGHPSYAIPDSNYVTEIYDSNDHPTGQYELTAKGEATLFDYICQIKQSNKLERLSWTAAISGVIGVLAAIISFVQ